jgi:hypothetical protein
MRCKFKGVDGRDKPGHDVDRSRTSQVSVLMRLAWL